MCGTVIQPYERSEEAEAGSTSDTIATITSRCALNRAVQYPRIENVRSIKEIHTCVAERDKHEH